jgi:hypothetical protein
MIKTTARIITRSSKSDYPQLLASKSSGSIVMAYQSMVDGKSFAGVVVHTPDGNNIGDWSDRWQHEAFDAFSGEITLKQ